MTEKKKGKSSIPWTKIKNEYCSGATMRSLSRKYNVPCSTISLRCRTEEWKKVSAQVIDKTEQKVVEKIAERNSNTIDLMNQAVDLLLKKTLDGIDKADTDDSSRMKQYSSILKDLKEIGVYRSDLDRAEQMARIEKLRKESQTEETTQTITVEFKGDIDGYAN